MPDSIQPYPSPSLSPKLNEINGLLDQTDQQIERMRVASQLATNIKDLAPAITPIISNIITLIQGISASYNSIENTKLNLQDKRHMRETVAPIVRDHINNLHEEFKDLTHLIGAMEGQGKEQLIQQLGEVNKAGNALIKEIIFRMM